MKCNIPMLNAGFLHLVFQIAPNIESLSEQALGPDRGPDRNFPMFAVQMRDSRNCRETAERCEADIACRIRRLR
jgi:hypothetical protein